MTKNDEIYVKSELHIKAALGSFAAEAESFTILPNEEDKDKEKLDLAKLVTYTNKGEVCGA